MEASSHGLAQDRLAGVEFDVAMLTNLTRDHLDYHGTMRRYQGGQGAAVPLADAQSCGRQYG